LLRLLSLRLAGELLQPLGARAFGTLDPAQRKRGSRNQSHYGNSKPGV